MDGRGDDDSVRFRDRRLTSSAGGRAGAGARESESERREQVESDLSADFDPHP